MRKRTLSLIALALVLIVVSLTLIVIQARNSSSSAETSGPATVEGSRYPLNLTMTISETGLRLGQELVIHLTLENIGNETLGFSFSDGHDAFYFSVYNETGGLVYSLLDEAKFPMVRHVLQMAPESQRNVTEWWDQRDDFVYSEGECYYTKVPAGSYSIKGGFTSGTLGDSRLGFTVETPSVSFEIQE